VEIEGARANRQFEIAMKGIDQLHLAPIRAIRRDRASWDHLLDSSARGDFIDFARERRYSSTAIQRTGEMICLIRCMKDCLRVGKNRAAADHFPPRLFRSGMW